MISLQDRIDQFRKMATDDPTNELAHFSLGKALLEDNQHAEAAKCFAETVRLNADFSKAYQLQAQCLIQLGKKPESIEALLKGFAVADARGDRMPRDEMAKMLKELGETPPAPKESTGPAPEGPGGFHCQRPGCPAGVQASQLPAPPINDDLGKAIYENICTVCWREWLGMGIKVINEMRLDLSTETGQQMYDQYMKEFLGLS